MDRFLFQSKTRLCFSITPALIGFRGLMAFPALASPPNLFIFFCFFFWLPFLLLLNYGRPQPAERSFGLADHCNPVYTSYHILYAKQRFGMFQKCLIFWTYFKNIFLSSVMYLLCLKQLENLLVCNSQSFHVRCNHCNIHQVYGIVYYCTLFWTF